MNIQSFFKTAVLTSVTVLSCNWGLLAQANTPRGTSGINVGSEVVGGSQVDRATNPNMLSPDQQSASTLASMTASRAIAAVKQGDHTFAFPTRNGMATVISLPTIGGPRSAIVTLNLPTGEGGSSRQQQYTVANSASGAELTGLFVLADQLNQLGKNPSRDEVKTMLAMYNNFVKSTSPEVLVLLSNLPEFQAIRTQLTSLRNIANSP
jgi:hypothetical protein